MRVVRGGKWNELMYKNNITTKNEIMNKYLYVVEAGQFSFEVEIDKLLGKSGDVIFISRDGIDPDGFEVEISRVEDNIVYCSMHNI